MRIAVVCPHYGYITRGTERCTEEIVKKFIEHGHKVDVFSLGKNGNTKEVDGLKKDKGLGKLSHNFAENTMFGGFCKKYIGISPHLEDMVFGMKLQERETEFMIYDVILSRGEYWETLACKKIASHFCIPVVSAFSGGNSKMMIEQAKLSDTFIVNSPAYEKWIKEQLPEINSICIPGAVDLNIFNPNVNPSCFDNKYEHPIVISTSALIPAKRINLIIDAMTKLGKGTLIVTNDGPNKNEILKKGKKQLGNRFVYVGIVPLQTLVGLYVLSDVCVLASKNEPFGLVVLDSMACNTPVIAQKEATEWLIGDGGYVVDDCEDIENLAKTIEKTYETEWDNRPRKQAEKFGWEEISLKFEKVLEDTI
jgi:glycosyltransferase involved in cell wall biosynthesis